MRDSRGCHQCKSRRRKCAGERPRCSGCLKRGLKCDYVQRILWQQDAVRDGTTFGRAGIQNSSNIQDELNYYIIPLSTPSVYLINYTKQDFEDIYDIVDDDFDSNTNSIANDNSSSTSATPFSSLSYTSLSFSPSIGAIGDIMLHYYRETVCGKRVLIDGLDNPFRQLIIPISLSSEMLSHAVAAFAAHDLLNQRLLTHKEQHEKALYHNKCRALSLLRRHCNTETIQRSTTLERDAMLLTISFLCHLDVSGGSKGQWAHHLRGSSSIIKAVRDIHQSASFSDKTQWFVLGFLYTLMDFCVGDTWLSPDDQHTTQLLDETRSFFEIQSARDSVTIDPSIGLSWGLVDIIHSANRLHRQLAQAGAGESQGPIVEQSLALEGRLRNLTQIYDGVDDTHHILMTAEAYKLACFLFIYHGLHGHSSHSPSIRHDHLPKLIQLLEDIAFKQGHLLGTFPYPMWPMFIAAAFANESQRATIMFILTIMKGYRPKSNTISMEAAIKAVWKRRDLSEGNLLGAVGRGRLEWQDTLKSLGWTLGLN